MVPTMVLFTPFLPPSQIPARRGECETSTLNPAGNGQSKVMMGQMSGLRMGNKKWTVQRGKRGRKEENKKTEGKGTKRGKLTGNESESTVEEREKDKW